MLESTPALQFDDHERDMCVLQHELEIVWTQAAAREAGLKWMGSESSGLMLERRVSRMIAFGSDDKDGASLCVCARACDLLLDIFIIALD